MFKPVKGGGDGDACGVGNRRLVITSSDRSSFLEPRPAAFDQVCRPDKPAVSWRSCVTARPGKRPKLYDGGLALHGLRIIEAPEFFEPPRSWQIRARCPES
jgi:hypothetical protein